MDVATGPREEVRAVLDRRIRARCLHIVAVLGVADHIDHRTSSPIGNPHRDM
jgi:hypothetical protein